MGKKVYHDIKGACEYANVDRRTIYNWIKRGILIDGEIRLFLPMRTFEGMPLVNEIDLDNFMIEIGHNPEEENNQTIDQQSKKGVSMAEDESLDAQDVLDYLEDVMEENKLRPGQKIDTLLHAVEDEIEEEED
ncbi:unnamed protein product [marine sediment metagenome]|uniref:Helix-turn-helix domain-containing protein n=1 Tax=marine sediment metagenome TaxID=412755 RepID=X1JPK0_9ZZZZ